MKNRMNTSSYETIQNGVSIALEVLDDYTGFRAAGCVIPALEGVKRKFVRNIGGYYVMPQIGNGVYKLSVSSEFYFLYEDVVKVEEASINPLLKVIRLIPAPSYPFPVDAALIRGTVSNVNREVIEDVNINSTILQPENYPVASLEEDIEVSENRIHMLVIGGAGAIKSGDFLLIMDKDVSKLEYIRIKETPDDTGLNYYTVEEQVMYGHDRDTEIFPMKLDKYDTVITEKGDFVVYIKSLVSSRGFVELEIKADRFKPYKRKFVLSEGQKISAGGVFLSLV